MSSGLPQQVYHSTLQSALPPAETLLAVQSAVAAHHGILGQTSLEVASFQIPPHGTPEHLKEAGATDANGDLNPLYAVSLEANLIAVAAGTEVRLRASSIMMDLGHLIEPTLGAFMSTLQGSIASVVAQRRPPNVPPPSR